MQDLLVSLKNVTFSYDDERIILKNISMDIPKGKTVAIMGGSGSGKTTLLRLITGQYQPQKGSVRVFNQDLSQLSNQKILNLRKRMGMLFQFGALFTDMSVYENVAFSLKEHTKLPDVIIQKIVAMKLNAVGLFGTQHMATNELSGGMARRVALARSTALDPELMLYDEPFTGLDPISLNVTTMLIRKLNDTLQQTSILVTHDIKSSLKIVDYVFFMANGEIIASGTPDEVINSDNLAVKQFINGEISGPFNYEFQTKMSYNNYLGINQ